MPKLSAVPPAASSPESPIWFITASELLRLLRGEIVWRKGRRMRLRLTDDLLDRELESIVDRAMQGWES